MSIYSACEAQITLLLIEEVEVLKEYAYFLNVFLKKSATVLLNCLDIDKHIIDLKPGK